MIQLVHHISPERSPNLWALEHLWRWGCEISAMCSLAVNRLPSSKRLAQWPTLQRYYELLITILAFFALNWRKRLPSADVLDADPLDQNQDRERVIHFHEPEPSDSSHDV